MLHSLLELRQRILIVLVFFCTLFILFFLGANPLFLFVIKPLQQALAPHSELIATQVTSTVLIPLTIAANASFLCTTPFALVQLWYFAAPGLYHQEKRFFIMVVGGSLLLFMIGIIFCFIVVLPLMFQFFAEALPPGVKLMPDITSSTTLITRMLWLFGLSFQVPLLCAILVRLGWVELQTLKQIRPYVIVGAFIIGMLLTPPDVLSQMMLAVPLCILYELGIILAASKKRLTIRHHFLYSLRQRNRWPPT